MLDKEYETINHEEELDAFCHACDNIESCISNKEKHKKYSKISGPINPQYSNKLDQIIDILLSDLDPKEVEDFIIELTKKNYHFDNHLFFVRLYQFALLHYIHDYHCHRVQDH